MNNEIAILSEASNCPVVKMPGRKFPGVVLQGDSLKSLLSFAEEIEQLSAPFNNDEINTVINDLKSKLAGYVNVYETTMKAKGLQLPYTS